MKNILISILILLSSICAQAENWNYYETVNESMKMYVDWQSIHKQDGYLKIWIFWSYDKPQNGLIFTYRGVRELVYLDCMENTYQMKEDDYFIGPSQDSKIVHKASNEIIGLHLKEEIRPNSLMSRFIASVCKK